MSTIFKKVVTLGFQKLLPHTRLPSVFMTKTEDQLDDEPKDFVGDEYRVSGAPGFTDDRVRNDDDYVKNGVYKNLINTVKAAIFGTIEKNNVTVVGDPSYTSGAHI